LNGLVKKYFTAAINPEAAFDIHKNPASINVVWSRARSLSRAILRRPSADDNDQACPCARKKVPIRPHGIRVLIAIETSICVVLQSTPASAR
jgi:hypothetical protein